MRVKKKNELQQVFFTVSAVMLRNNRYSFSLYYPIIYPNNKSENLWMMNDDGVGAYTPTSTRVVAIPTPQPPQPQQLRVVSQSSRGSSGSSMSSGGCLENHRPPHQDTGNTRHNLQASPPLLLVLLPVPPRQHPDQHF
jgi:hypothetical protein